MVFSFATYSPRNIPGVTVQLSLQEQSIGLASLNELMMLQMTTEYIGMDDCQLLFLTRDFFGHRMLARGFRRRKSLVASRGCPSIGRRVIGAGKGCSVRPTCKDGATIGKSAVKRRRIAGNGYDLARSELWFKWRLTRPLWPRFMAGRLTGEIAVRCVFRSVLFALTADFPVQFWPD